MQEFLCFSILTAFLLDKPPVLEATPAHYYYEPKISQLSGRLEYHKFVYAGPPYWGDGKDFKGNPVPDVMIDVLVFEPDRPIDVEATAISGPDQESFDDVDVIEVGGFIGHGHDDALDRYVGRHVRIFGYLYERTRGIEYTDVLLAVKSVVPKTRKEASHIFN